MAKKVLVVDDEKLIVKGIRFSLEQDGMEVECAYDGEEALKLATENSYDMILLDLMLPKMDGFEVCQRIRDFSNVPIVMLTAKGEERDVIRGLDLGANDYITKPFSRPILLARIRAVLRSATGRAAGPYICDGLVLAPKSHVVTLDGKRLSLTPGEYRMLELFLSRPNRIHTRAAILDAIQTETKDVTDRLVDVMLVALRRKLGTWATHIETVRGIGYRLDR